MKCLVLLLLPYMDPSVFEVGLILQGAKQGQDGRYT